MGRVQRWWGSAKRKLRIIKKVEVTLPFGLGKVEIQPDYAEQQVAWELYVELATRVALQPIDGQNGHLREALSSLYSMFTTTRTILREAGPQVAGHPNSVGAIAVKILNSGIRPFLSKWHPALGEWEARHETSKSMAQREATWPRNHEFREELTELNANLQQYVEVLAKVAGVEI